MNIIIEHSKTKREINGAFNVCGSRDNLRNMAQQIINSTPDDFCYGWIAVRTNQQDSIANTKPVSWDEVS